MTRLEHILRDFDSGAKFSPLPALNKLVRVFRSELKSSTCSLYLYNEQIDSYVLVANCGKKIKKDSKIAIKSDEGLIGLVAKSEGLINLKDATLHPKYQPIEEIGEAKYPVFLAVPIVFQQICIGVISLTNLKNKTFKYFEEGFLLTAATALSETFSEWFKNGTILQLTKEFTTTKQSDLVYKGQSASNGLAIGIVHYVETQKIKDFKNVKLEDCRDPKKELMILSQALSDVRMDILKESSSLAGIISDNERMIFTTYVHMLDNNNLGGEVKQLIQQRYTALSAWKYIIAKHCHSFSMVNNDYLRSRMTDTYDLGLRVVNKMLHYKSEVTYPNQPFILGAKELTPSMLLKTPRKHLVGLITINGSTNSHLAILARAMGIPTVNGISGFDLHKYNNSKIVIDGSSGKIITNLSVSTLQEYQALIADNLDFSNKLAELDHEKSVTTDGCHIELQINSGLFTKDTEKKHENHSIGLFRSETIFLNRDVFPTEDEQIEFYQQVLAAKNPLPVTFRTLDIGGDKQLSYFNQKEDNPYLGWRGIRVSLDHPELFNIQIRALLRSNIGYENLRVLLPMVSFTSELDNALQLIKDAYNQLIEEGYIDVVIPPIGIMVEIPSMIYLIPKIANKADFLSVGSNDLIQYIEAVDRNNLNVATNYRPLDPSILACLKQIKDLAMTHQLELSICGELASDYRGIIALIGLGYHRLSMTSQQLTKAKMLIRAINVKDCEQLVDNLLQFDNESDVVTAIDEYLNNNKQLDSHFKFL